MEIIRGVCFYFQVHQPFRIRKDFSVFDIGKSQKYFDDKKNQAIMKKVAEKCYLPANKILLDSLAKHEDFKVAFSITGTIFEQFQEFAPNVLKSFMDLAKTGGVEFLVETYNHSLSFLFDKDEFKHQIAQHKQLVKSAFNQKPKIFRNTELIYSNELAKEISKLGFKAILAEGAEKILGWRSPNFVYKAKNSNMKLLLKNYKLSDDVAFRFGQRSWEGWPLTANKYATWINDCEGDFVNLFLDYETFGEHQWDTTGIFDFLTHLPQEIKNQNLTFFNPSELLKFNPKASLDFHEPVSWADTERDVSAWLGNDLQKSAAAQLYKIKGAVLRSNNQQLIDSWRKLTTSDHFYYMCTKWFNDGDVHKYFNPYDTPYEGYIAFMNVLNDIAHRVKSQNLLSKTKGLKKNKYPYKRKRGV